MDERAYSLLGRLYQGEQLSRAEHETAIAGLATTERNLESQAFNYIQTEKFLTSLDPTASNFLYTKQKISEVGIKAYEKERDKRDNEFRQQSENKWIETLQIKLLQANIQLAESAIAANAATIRNYEWQRKNGNRTVFFIGLSAFFSLALIITMFVVQDTQSPKLFKNQIQIEDSIRHSLKSIDSTFQKAMKDSFYRRR